jgi:G:T-mismatch repair DNA endonuclease (very short patch repair protein)
MNQYHLKFKRRKKLRKKYVEQRNCCVLLEKNQKNIAKNRRNTLELQNSGFELSISCLTKLHQKIWKLKSQLPPVCNAYKNRLLND